MRVTIAYDAAAARSDAPPDQQAVLGVVAAVGAALSRLGHTPLTVGLTPDAADSRLRLAAVEPAVVFNLCEALGGDSAAESDVARLIERIGMPITGSPAASLELARRKDHVNAMLGSAGLPVPPWTVLANGGPLPAWHAYPAIVKPAAEDGSVGITCDSVARSAAEMMTAVAEANGRRPLLIQAFVGTRELAVGLVGDVALPVAEIDFSDMPAGRPRLVSYDAKWSSGSVDDRGTRPVCPASLEPEVAERASALARSAWLLVGGRGYGRVDLRLDDDGGLYVIEVNPNPDLDPNAGLARMAAAAGWSYDTLVSRILREAVTRRA